MKINKKLNISSDLNNSNLQNNQKKDFLKNLNQNVKNSKIFFSRKFFKDLGIVESVGDGIINILGTQKIIKGKNCIHKMYKRNMFTTILKKSKSNTNVSIIKETSVITEKKIFKGGPFLNDNLVSPRGSHNKDKKILIDNNENEKEYKEINDTNVLENTNKKEAFELNQLLKKIEKNKFINEENIIKNPRTLLKKSKSNDEISSSIKNKEDDVSINKVGNIKLFFKNNLNNLNKKNDLLDLYNSCELTRTQTQGYVMYRKLDKDSFSIKDKTNTKILIKDKWTSLLKEETFLFKNDNDNKPNYTKEQFFVYKDMTRAIIKAFRHIVLIDRIKVEGDEVTYWFLPLTTKDWIVNFGGPNKFPPIFVYYDIKKNKNFYIAPIKLLNTVTRAEYTTMVQEQTKDDLDFQLNVVKNAMELQKDPNSKIEFYEMHIRYDCLEKKIEDINPLEKFKKSNPEYEITPLVEKLETDLMVIVNTNH